MPLRNFSPIEVKLTERRRMEQPLLAMVLLAVVTFGLAEQKPTYVFMIIAVAAVAVNFFAVRRAMEISVSKLFVHIGVGIASAVGLVELVTESAQPVVALGHYITLILVCKLFERKTNRDYVQMLALSLLLMVPSGLICEEMWLSVAYLAFLGLALYTSMIFTLKRGLDAAAAARLNVESQPLEPDRVAWNVIRNWPARTIGRLACWLLATVLLVGVAVFVIAPRGIREVTEAGFQQTTASFAGFTTDVRLGDTREVIFNDRVSMRVKIDDPAGGQPDESLIYIRGKTFNHYADSRWQQSGNRQVSRSEFDKMEPDTAGAVEMKFKVDPRLLAGAQQKAPVAFFAPYPAVKIEIPDKPNLKIRYGSDLQPAFVQSGRLDGSLVYSARVWRGPLKMTQQKFLQAFEEKFFPWPFKIESLGIETVPKRVVDLAREWTADLLKERQKATGQADIDRINQRIVLQMKAKLQDRCSYSLDLAGADPKKDGVDNFLFNMKKGHCEYFASSMAVMLRVVGVRARLVAGFKLEPRMREGDEYVVRDRDGHAWVEVFTPSTGWYIIDPTPPDLTAGEQAKGFWGPVRSFWQDVRTFWFEKIIGYDEASRMELMKGVKDWLAGVLSPAAELVRRIWRAVMHLFSGGRFELVLLWPVAVVGLLAIFVWAARRRLAERRRRGPKPGRAPVAKAINPALEFLFELFDRLHAMGLEHRQQQTLMEFADRAASTLGLPHRDLADLVRLHYRWRWGDVEPVAAELADAKQKADGIIKLLEG